MKEEKGEKRETRRREQGKDDEGAVGRGVAGMECLPDVGRIKKRRPGALLGGTHGAEASHRLSSEGTSECGEPRGLGFRVSANRF